MEHARPFTQRATLSVSVICVFCIERIQAAALGHTALVKCDGIKFSGICFFLAKCYRFFVENRADRPCAPRIASIHHHPKGTHMKKKISDSAF